MIAAALAMLCAATPAMQDDPIETRIHNVEFLTRAIPDLPGTPLSLAEGVGGASVDGRAPAPMDGESLISLIRNNVAEDTWAHVAASVHFGDEMLTVTNRRSVQARIGEYLDYWRGLFGKMVVVDAVIVSVEPEFLAGLRAGGPPERPAILPTESFEKLVAAAREGKVAALVKTMRATAHSGQRVHMADLARRRFIADIDTQTAVGMAALDPIPSTLTTGVMIDVRPRIEPFAGAVTLEVRIDRAELKALEERTLRLPRELFPAWPVVQSDPKHPTPDQPLPGAARRLDEPKIQQPKIGVDRIRTTLTVRDGETAVAGLTFRGGRCIVYLLRPTVVALDDKVAAEPAFDEDRLLKLYDISPLTRAVPDWAGPKIGLEDSRFGGGPALAGATFALEEPAMQVGPEHIVEMLRTRIAPETWGNQRNRLDVTEGRTLLVRQRPEVLREIDRFLGELISARAQMITVETTVIGFRKGARAEWEGKIPALRPGGYFVPRERFDELLKEAFKGVNVRLVEMGEVTAFPQERVFAARLEEERILADLEPQISTVASHVDPVQETLSGGFVFDVRPHFIRGRGLIGVELRLQHAEHKVAESTGAMPGAGPLQVPSGTEFGRQSNVACREGHVTLVGIETRGSGDEAEEVALFLRARPNVLK